MNRPSDQPPVPASGWVLCQNNNEVFIIKIRAETVSKTAEWEIQELMHSKANEVKMYGKESWIIGEGLYMHLNVDLHWRRQTENGEVIRRLDYCLEEMNVTDYFTTFICWNFFHWSDIILHSSQTQYTFWRWCRFDWRPQNVFLFRTLFHLSRWTRMLYIFPRQEKKAPCIYIKSASTPHQALQTPELFLAQAAGQKAAWFFMSACRCKRWVWRQESALISPWRPCCPFCLAFWANNCLHLQEAHKEILQGTRKKPLFHRLRARFSFEQFARMQLSVQETKLKVTFHSRCYLHAVPLNRWLHWGSLSGISWMHSKACPNEFGHGFG